MTITVTKTFATEAEAAAWLSGATPAATTDKPSKPAADKPSKPAAKKPVSEHTKEEMVAALQALRDAKGKEAAKAVITEFGGVDKMAEIPDDKIDAVYDAAKAAESEDEGM